MSAATARHGNVSTHLHLAQNLLVLLLLRRGQAHLLLPLVVHHFLHHRARLAVQIAQRAVLGLELGRVNLWIPNAHHLHQGVRKAENPRSEPAAAAHLPPLVALGLGEVDAQLAVLQIPRRVLHFDALVQLTVHDGVALEHHLEAVRLEGHRHVALEAALGQRQCQRHLFQRLRPLVRRRLDFLCE